MKPKYFLEKLQKFPHRGFASENEKKAAKLIYKEYQKMGLKPKIQKFKVTKNSWLIHAAIFFILAVSIIFLFVGNIPIAIIFLLIGLTLYLEFPYDPSLIYKNIYPATSQNIYVEVDSQHPARKTVVVLGHYDTAKRTLGILLMAKIFAKRKVDLVNAIDKKLPNFFRSPYLFLNLSIMLSLLIPFLTSSPTLKIILGCFVIYNMMAPCLLAIHAALSPFVPGALDNGSGAATVMSLASYFKTNRPKATRLIFLNTGNEENMPNGVVEFAKDRNLDKQNTYFINLDGIGCEQLVATYGETMYWGISRFYDKNLFKIVKNLIKKEKKFNMIKESYLGLGTDAGRLVQERYRVMVTLMSLSKEGHGYPFHYHQMDDTIDKINFDTMDLCKEFVIALINTIDKQKK